jgi:hypothetical protein
MGTSLYMAPEQVEHPQAVDHRADIYSLGVVFYEMLTDELPMGKFQPPSAKVRIDVRLDEVVLKALAKEPDRRYQQASQIKTKVETIAKTAGVGGQGTGINRQGLEGKSGPPLSVPAPRFSGKAIAGVCWAPLFCLAAVPMGILWSASSVHRVGIRFLEIALLVIPMPVSFAAPFGTTILGWVAVAEIRRSGGRIYGLGLALFDGLLFPLLLLDALVIWIGLASRLIAIEGVILALPIDVVIGWLAWCATKQPLESTSPIPSTPAPRRRGLPLFLVLIGLTVLGLIALCQGRPYSQSSMELNADIVFSPIPLIR